MVVTITKLNFEEEITKSKLPVVLKIYASWCGPCMQMAPLYDELAKELSSTYKFAQMNVDDSRELSIQYGVTSIPTIIFIKNNEVVGREVGYLSKDDLKERILEYLH
jgi:thioredoxin 1